MTLFACLALPVASSVRFARTASTVEEFGNAGRCCSDRNLRILTPDVEVGMQALERSSAAPASEARKSPVTSSININPKLALFLTVLYGLLLLWRVVSLVRAWHRTRIILKSAFACEFFRFLSGHH